MELDVNYQTRRWALRLRGLSVLLGCSAALAGIVLLLGPFLLVPLLAAELVFAVWFFRAKNKLSAQPRVHRPEVIDGLAAFQHMLAIVASNAAAGEGFTMSDYVSDWFRGMPAEEIGRENFADLMAYGFWYRTREEMDSLGLGHVPLEMTLAFEQLSGLSFKPGRNPDARFMAHLWEDVKYRYMPLTFYLGSEAVSIIVHFVLLYGLGFDSFHHDNRTYYTHRIPRRPTVTVPEVMHAAVTAGEAAAAPPPPGAALKVPNRKLSNVFPLFGNALGNVARTATRSMLGDLRQLGLQGEVGMDTKAPGEPQDAAAAGRGPGAGPELQKCSSVARKATALNMIEAAHAELADVTQKARAHRASTPSGGSFSAGSGSASCVGRRANSFCFAAANGAAANGGLPVQALSGVMEGDGEAYAVARDIASHAIEERDKAKAEHAAAASRRTTTIGSGSGAASTDNDGTPILFLHGLVGVFPYLDFIASLVAIGRPMIVPSMKNISLRVVGSVASVEEIYTTVMQFLEARSMNKVHVVAHSFGTFIASRLAKTHPAWLASCTLIDPVCFNMFMPKLIRAFFYTSLRKKDFVAAIRGGLQGIKNILKDIGVGIISRDLFCAISLSRKFYWSDVNLWPHEVPRHTMLVLSHKDRFMHSAECAEMCANTTSAEILYHKSLSHAEFLFTFGWQDSILASLLRLMRRTSRKASWSQAEVDQIVREAKLKLQ